MMPEKKSVGLVAFLLLASVLTTTSVANLVPHSTAQENGPCTVTFTATYNSTSTQSTGTYNQTLSSGGVSITVTAAGNSITINPYAINATLTWNVTQAANGTYTVIVSGHNVYITWPAQALGLNTTQPSNLGYTLTTPITTASSTTLNTNATSSATLPACETQSTTSASSSSTQAAGQS